MFETVSICIFTAEYVLRLWSCTSLERFAKPVLGRLRYALSPMAIVDLLAVMPFFLPALGLDLRSARLLRLFRVLRMAKLARYSKTLQLFGRIATRKKEELITVLGMLRQRDILIIALASAGCRPAAETEAPRPTHETPSAPSVVDDAAASLADAEPMPAHPVDPVDPVEASEVDEKNEAPELGAKIVAGVWTRGATADGFTLGLAATKDRLQFPYTNEGSTHLVLACKKGKASAWFERHPLDSWALQGGVAWVSTVPKSKSMKIRNREADRARSLVPSAQSWLDRLGEMQRIELSAAGLYEPVAMAIVFEIKGAAAVQAIFAEQCR